MKNKLMGHFVLGYPTLEKSIEIAVEYQKNGIDILECQFPFSDPSADGPVITNANMIASKYTTDELFFALSEIKKKTSAPVVLMSYITRIHSIGFRDFFSRCSEIGITEFIIPDVPYDEAIRINLIETLKSYGCQLIPVISTNTAIERVEEFDTYDFPFYYLMSYHGTTGQSVEVNMILKSFINDLKKISTKEIGVGFGIKTKEQVDEINSFANFSIIGSELLRKSESMVQLSEFIRSLK